jgi:hypothetical protein
LLCGWLMRRWKNSYNEARRRFYSEEKRQLYLGIKSGHYVICFHYPVDSFWTEETVQRFKEEMMRDIIETEPALFRNFAIKLLGGIK